MPKTQRRKTQRRKKKTQRFLRKKSHKQRKSKNGGSRGIASFVASCIQKLIPVTSKYLNNDDDWTKLAKKISEMGPLEIECNGNNLYIYTVNIDIDMENNRKRGEMYVNIDNGNRVILLWKNGLQQTYEPPTNQILNTNNSQSNRTILQ